MAGAGQGFPGVEDPEAAVRIQQLESELELERGLREGAEKQAAAYYKFHTDCIVAKLATNRKCPSCDKPVCAEA